MWFVSCVRVFMNPVAQSSHVKTPPNKARFVQNGLKRNANRLQYNTQRFHRNDCISVLRKKPFDNGRKILLLRRGKKRFTQMFKKK